MEKTSPTVKRLVVGGIALAIVAVVVLLMQPGASEQPADNRPAGTAAKRDSHSPSPELPGKLLPGLGGEEPPVMDDEALDALVKKDPKLALFMKHKKLVLPSKQGLDEYHKLLSDLAMMKAMAEDLMDPGKGHPGPEEYYHRLMVVDYFTAGLNWKDNPQRAQLIQVTQNVITKDNFEPDQDSARRQVLGGTKMELYRTLAEQDPAKANELVAQAKGTRMEKMVDWMAAEDTRRTVREKEIWKQADDMARGN